MSEVLPVMMIVFRGRTSTPCVGYCKGLLASAMMRTSAGVCDLRGEKKYTSGKMQTEAQTQHIHPRAWTGRQEVDRCASDPVKSNQKLLLIKGLVASCIVEILWNNYSGIKGASIEKKVLDWLKMD